MTFHYIVLDLFFSFGVMNIIILLMNHAEFFDYSIKTHDSF